jgi:hypothetical protein
MNQVLLNIIGEVMYLTRAMFAEYGRILALDVQYTDHADEFTQEAIDSVQSLHDAGVTQADLASAVYALKMMKVQIDDVNRDAFIKFAKL